MVAYNPSEFASQIHPAFATLMCHRHNAARLHKGAKDNKIYSESRQENGVHKRLPLENKGSWQTNVCLRGSELAYISYFTVDSQ